MFARLVIYMGIVCASLATVSPTMAESHVSPPGSRVDSPVDQLSRATAPVPPTNPLSLAMFYHPPKDGTSLPTVVNQFASAVFTRGDEHYRDQMRAAGFTGPVLQYIVANEASGPGGLNHPADPCGVYTESGNDVAGLGRDFCTELHHDERNFLHNSRGERLFSTLSWQEQTGTITRYYYLMNPATPSWQGYFARHVAHQVRSGGYSGVFLDNIDRTLERGQIRAVNSDGVVAEFADDDQYRAAVVEYLRVVRRHVGNAPMWGNITSNYLEPLSGELFVPYLDGVMNEFFAALWRDRLANPSVWEEQLRQAESSLRSGKQFIAVAHGNQRDRERLHFALASFLLVTQSGAYFRYTQDGQYDEAWLFDDYQTRLGHPLGERYKRGAQWRRDFACGFVEVDPSAHTGVIHADSRMPTCG